MIEWIVTTVPGLVLGLITGWYFERRATLSAKAQAEDLRRQLREMRESIYTVGGTAPADTTQRTKSGASTADEVYRWTSHVQDASGKVSRELVTTRFRTSGIRPAEVDEAITLLIQEGRLRADGDYLEVT